jgi:hypothetical protein
MASPKVCVEGAVKFEFVWTAGEMACDRTNYICKEL